MTNLLAIFIGGGAGSLLRYGISKWMIEHDSGFPFATLVTNILACIVLALAIVFFSKRMDFSEPFKLMVMIGFCGGFSTFSTFSLEMFRLMEKGLLGQAFLYAGASVVGCMAVIYVILKVLG